MEQQSSPVQSLLHQGDQQQVAEENPVDVLISETSDPNKAVVTFYRCMQVERLRVKSGAGTMQYIRDFARAPPATHVLAAACAKMHRAQKFRDLAATATRDARALARTTLEQCRAFWERRGIKNASDLAQCLRDRIRKDDRTLDLTDEALKAEEDAEPEVVPTDSEEAYGVDRSEKKQRPAKKKKAPPKTTKKTLARKKKKRNPDESSPDANSDDSILPSSSSSSSPSPPSSSSGELPSSGGSDDSLDEGDTAFGGAKCLLQHTSFIFDEELDRLYKRCGDVVFFGVERGEEIGDEEQAGNSDRHGKPVWAYCEVCSSGPVLSELNGGQPDRADVTFVGALACPQDYKEPGSTVLASAVAYLVNHASSHEERRKLARRMRKRNSRGVRTGAVKAKMCLLDMARRRGAEIRRMAWGAVSKHYPPDIHMLIRELVSVIIPKLAAEKGAIAACVQHKFILPESQVSAMRAFMNKMEELLDGSERGVSVRRGWLRSSFQAGYRASSGNSPPPLLLPRSLPPRMHHAETTLTAPATATAAGHPSGRGTPTSDHVRGHGNMK